MSFSDSEEDEAMVMLEAARYTGRADRINDHSPPKKKRKLSHKSSSIIGHHLKPTLPSKHHQRRSNINNINNININTNHYPPQNTRNRINLRQRGSNINISKRPKPNNNNNNNNNNNMINIISSSESDSDDNEYDDDSSSSSSNDNYKENQNHSTMRNGLDINPKKRSRAMISDNNVNRALYLQNQQRRRNNIEYNDDSSSSSSSTSPPTARATGTGTTTTKTTKTILPILPISTQPVYRFGNKQYPNPLNINPGAIVRLELINFLCHSNFSITFHPNINIISGENGSGKSAIEAGISMALGTSARKTTRGNTVRDVIKFNEDFAKIRLYLHNRGPEALREYGSEICIERKLSTNGKNGTSSFKVLDNNLKTIGNGMRSVRDIAERLNIHVDNPCVVLKQEAAKQFLNSAKDRDKYRFFMQASKLGDFVEVLRESMDNVDIALEQQKQTKESFGLIQQQYNECRRNYDNLISIQSQEKLISFYIKSEKWMKYHGRLREVNRYRNKAETFKNRVIRGRSTFEQQKVLLHESVKRATSMKKQIETNAKDIEQYKLPIIAIKKELKNLEKKRKELIRKQSAKQKLIDRSNKKIKDFKREIKTLKHQIQNDERGKKLTEINEKINKFQLELNENKLNLPNLQNKSNPTIEMKEKQQILQRKENVLQSKKYEIKRIKNELKKLKSQKTSTSELFCPQIAKRNGITISEIRSLINYNKRKFKRIPIGPLGQYISVKCDDNDNNDNNDKYIGVIQAALGNIINMFLVETSSDQQLFRKLCYQKFKIVIPCIQYAFDNKRYKIKVNPFKNNADLLRINDLFEIKQDIEYDGWIFNTIITSTQCDRCYAYGTLQTARKFLSQLNGDKLKYISCIYTYLEEKIYKISRRGQSVSGTPVISRPPVIGADTTRLIQHYTSILTKELSEQQIMENECNELSLFVNNIQIQLNGFQNQLRNIKRNINKLEISIETLINEKSELEDDNECNQSLTERIIELENCINDEESVIESYFLDITPYKDEIYEIGKLEEIKRNKLDELESNVHNETLKVKALKLEFQTFLDEIKKERINIEKIPEKLRNLESQLNVQLKFVESEEKEMQRLLDDAQSFGDQVTPDQYPCKPIHLIGSENKRIKFKLSELILYRKKIEASIQEWRQANNNPNEIIQRYETIKPKYEQHQEAVRKCNNNVDAMNLVLHERRREYKRMKECVTEQLNTEFRYVMRQQAHDGNLEVDFERGRLNLKVIMASHDQHTQNISNIANHSNDQHVVNSKTLSGGEKSFTQIALIMALQKFCGTPMCIYDEFDVFMDSVNRGNSIKILLKTAIKNGGDRQYIFITPHDVSPMMDRRYRDMIRIHKLNAPRPDR